MTMVGLCDLDRGRDLRDFACPTSETPAARVHRRAEGNHPSRRRHRGGIQKGRRGLHRAKVWGREERGLRAELKGRPSSSLLAKEKFCLRASGLQPKPWFVRIWLGQYALARET